MSTSRFRRIPAVVGAAVASVLMVLGLAAPASATWSIVAVEPETGKVGAAIASCVPAGLLGEPDQVLVPVVLIPGEAAAIAQGSINPESPVGLRQLLNDGASPEETIEALLDIDEVPSSRQFGIATFGTEADGAAAIIPSMAYTGDDVELERGDAVGANVSVQGVLLADSAVVPRTIEAFDAARAAGRPLEEALVEGLLAGSDAGGDRRCDEQTALFAHLAVAEPGDDPVAPSLLLTVTVDEGDGQNPVPVLATALADGRSGWVDIGLNEPAGIPRVAVMAVGVALSAAAYFTIKRGLGSPAARR